MMSILIELAGGVLHFINASLALTGSRAISYTLWGRLERWQKLHFG